MPPRCGHQGWWQGGRFLFSAEAVPRPWAWAESSLCGLCRAQGRAPRAASSTAER